MLAVRLKAAEAAIKFHCGMLLRVTGPWNVPAFSLLGATSISHLFAFQSI